MKAEAYAYISSGGSRPPMELTQLYYIDRFGALAVTGRQTLGAGEIRRMITADNIVRAYQDRATSKNWADWASKNKSMSRLLNEAAKLAEDLEDG